MIVGSADERDITVANSKRASWCTSMTEIPACLCLEGGSARNIPIRHGPTMEFQVASAPAFGDARIVRQDRLGGVVHEYVLAA